jgi:ELWxxDGT repeat protein
MRFASFRQRLRPRFGGRKVYRPSRKVVSRLPLCLELLETRLLPSLTPVLLPPINPHTSASNPYDTTEFDGRAFFSANDGIHGPQLWESNGSAAGTFMVKDINGKNVADPSYLTNMNGTLFFSANGGLWRTNATAAGTFLVKDAGAYGLTNVNGTLFFSGTNGTQLWKSNGTAAGTVLVQDINPYHPYPRSLTNVNGTLFFGAENGVRTELWRGNGSDTVMVKDINLASNNGVYLVNVNGTLFFSADDGTHGPELWRSNGTAAGTFLVKDIHPGPKSSYEKDLTNVNGTLFLSADDGTHGNELWKSNGTAAGTLLVQPGVYSPSDLININGTLFFSAEDGTQGNVLWESNGTAAGTLVVKDIHTVYPLSSRLNYLANVNGTLFFQANDGTHGLQLWESNGSAAGTVLVKDINVMNPEATDSYLVFLTNVNGTLFFSADDGTHGFELWESNGTGAGTVLVKDINQIEVGSKPTDIVAVGATAFFAANDGTHGTQLWESNGSAAGTHMVTDILNGSYGSYPRSLTNVNGTLFFSAGDGTNGFQLWESNGSAAGTFMVKEIYPGGAPRYLTNVNGTLFFGAEDSPFGPPKLWESNGTAAGTFQVKNISLKPPPGTTESPLANVNGTLFLSANDGTHGAELWRSNGTAAGTVLVADINPGPGGSYPEQITDVAGTAFFTINLGPRTSQLWESNGTSAGTFLVNDTGGYGLTNVNGTLFFSASGDLWRTNGSDTVVVTDINLASPGTNAVYLVNVNGTLFFRAQDGALNGAQLFKSNGTAAGTTQVANINPSIYGFEYGSYPAGLTNVNGTLFFEAVDGVHGQEIWESNGAADGTFLVGDVNPGPTGSNPKYLTNVNGTLFFQANDSRHGPDLWVLRSDGRAADTTTLSVSLDPSVYGEAVTFTARVSASAGSAGTPTGMVTFLIDDSDVGKVALHVVNGADQATFSTSSLAPGEHLVNAFYLGDSHFGPSTSQQAPVTQVVHLAPTTTTLASSLDPSVFGQGVTFTAKVSTSASGAGTPTGMVTFWSDDKNLGKVALHVVNGADQATFSTSSLAPGNHLVFAFYDGDFHFSMSTNQQPVNQVVNPAPTATTLASSANPSDVGQTLTVTATVSTTASGAGTPTGTVTFRVDGVTRGTGQLQVVNGHDQATFTTSSLSVGRHTINAFYGGDPHFGASNTSASPLIQVVSPTPTIPVVLSPTASAAPPSVASGSASEAIGALVANGVDRFFATAWTALPAQAQPGALRAPGRSLGTRLHTGRKPSLDDSFADL